MTYEVEGSNGAGYSHRLTPAITLEAATRYLNVDINGDNAEATTFTVGVRFAL